METNNAAAPTLSLQADPDIAGGFIVLAADGYILGFGDSTAEALTGARVSVMARRESRRFELFASVMNGAIDALT
jgi:hypothetical protein